MANEAKSIKDKAHAALGKKAVLGADIDFAVFADKGKEQTYISDLATLSPKQQKQLESIGMEVAGGERSGTYMQLDHSVVHCTTASEGVEILSTDDALKKYAGLTDYWWQAVEPDTDKYTARAALHQEHGYFIRAFAGSKIDYPVQACLYIGQEELVQDVHNIIIVEEGAELHVITGCATDPLVKKGMHIGISEFYVKKGGKLTFTMLHRWGEDIAVRPRTGVIIEEDGLYISNYICMRPVKDLQMYPTTKLVGSGAVSRINSILVAPPGSHMDVGGRAILAAPGTKSEIIARTISTGGVVINRGHLLGISPETKAHLECHGLLLSDQGIIHAVPELEARTSNAELSHEAAVGKIAPEEIEYLMARGLNEEEAVATIVRGFLNVNIEGLPAALAQEIDRAIQEFSLKK
ncbi:Fe-S cluster assembly scaffold protein SufB [Sporomusaceae bacterium BoRhaA]|uniref:SufB/SufD family protein n=1 Tax=Pelorhabdus rhamnosifermentans TaxID=2772457 RepID=UPI001C06436C|nr:SufD family Fe-S cluster assembly protein [Pelorhabdus rhamnosifermentans]MBU2701334.1 Fe-S cluster assembly scaffold protein SufB [Pelorhabdus rhamnosifermentans]